MPRIDTSADEFSFVETKEEAQEVSKAIKSARKKKRSKGKKRESRKQFCSSVEIPPALLKAKEMIIKKVFGGRKAWTKAHNERKKKDQKHGLENIIGVFIGQKMRRDSRGKSVPTAQLCVVVEVLKKPKTKAEEKEFRSEYMIDETYEIDGEIVHTDIQVGKRYVAQTAIAGDFCGLNQQSAQGQFESGTIGCFCSVFVKKKKWVCFLTNSHVIGDYLGVAIADEEQIHHPVGGRGEEHIGYYLKSGRDGVDAALAYARGSTVDAHAFQGGIQITSEVEEPSGDVMIYDVHRDRVSMGTVEDGPGDTQVGYPNVGTRQVDGVFFIRSNNDDGSVFSKPGNSGALVVSVSTGAPVGLLIGSQGPGSHISVAHRISFVMDELEITKILATN